MVDHQQEILPVFIERDVILGLVFIGQSRIVSPEQDGDQSGGRDGGHLNER